METTNTNVNDILNDERVMEAAEELVTTSSAKGTGAKAVAGLTALGLAIYGIYKAVKHFKNKAESVEATDEAAEDFETDAEFDEEVEE